MNSPQSRRDFLQKSALAVGAALTSRRLFSREGPAALPPELKSPRVLAPGPFQPTWESLTQSYRCPEWFRDAKFGIWAHWSAQCVPEQGDWYARRMYLPEDKVYAYHLANYGHPSKFGFMEIDHLWRAEKWEPEKLLDLYQRAGAKYFCALANHHDNFDAYDSAHHPWNSMRVGPKRDIVGTWAKAARARGMRFGVSNHSAHAWHWFQPAYGYDGDGPLAGVRYDAATLTKADGRGKWWEGLDPQDLYTGPNIPMPDGLDARGVADWHKQRNGWNNEPPPNNPRFVENWFRRCQDLVEKYEPDLLYFDNTELPLGQAGLDIAAHYYNRSIARHGGQLQVVLNSKKMKPEHRAAVVEDIERGVATGIMPEPWQTDTCIGQWHYSRAVAEQNKYKTVGQVVGMLLDIVSKNGNLMLSVPVRGDGTIDTHEVAFLEGLAKWMSVNGEGIFGSRPWKIYGEGPSTLEQAEAGQFGGARDVRTKPFTAQDVRFTSRGETLYAYLLAWPNEPRAVVKSLATGAAPLGGRKIAEVTLLGFSGKLEWSQTLEGLAVRLPAEAPSEHAVALRIRTSA